MDAGSPSPQQNKTKQPRQPNDINNNNRPAIKSDGKSMRRKFIIILVHTYIYIMTVLLLSDMNSLRYSFPMKDISAN